MTINASSYFRPCDCEGGIVEVDTTIYLAPSASADSPTGIIGSDITGDGSDIRPFFSIKRAMEYLEDYRIKVGAYVTIKGLPGHYRYNYNEHATEIKHKDAKYIRIDFDMLEPGYYHETSISTNTSVIKTNYDDYDLIEFTVDDIGTGFYQIKAGDYIKILPDNNDLSFETISIWAGYYLVSSVDVANNKITIVFKRHQVDGSYTSMHSYQIPDTISTSNVTVIKLSTHQYITHTVASDVPFLKSEYGFGGVQVNASNELYYNGQGSVYNNTYSGKQAMRYFDIYDGVINDVIFHLNGFIYGLLFENLQCNQDSTNNKLYCTITSCNHGLEATQCTLNNMVGFIGNCCGYPLIVSGSTINYRSTIKMCVSNNYYHGIALKQSEFNGYGLPTGDKIINTIYNYYGLSCTYSSTFNSVGVNSINCKAGIACSGQSSVRFFVNYDSTTTKSIMKYNENGVFCTYGGIVDISYTDLSDNEIGVRGSDNSTIVVTAVASASNVNSDITGCGSHGIYLNDGCNLRLYKTNITSSSNYDGILLSRNCNATLTECNISGNNRNGIYMDKESTCICGDCNINSNDIGIYCIINSRFYIQNTTSSYRIDNNTTYDIYARYNSQVDVRTHDAIANVNPTKNSTPVYSDASGGTYIIETII